MINKSNIFILSINIEPIDDPPQLKAGSKSSIINLAVGARFVFSMKWLYVC